MIDQDSPLPTPTLFDAIRLGPYVLPHRVFMAPLTRGRADPDGTPTDIMAVYYAQRASAGLIVSEATAISAQGVGWLNAPASSPRGTWRRGSPSPTVYTAPAAASSYSSGTPAACRIQTSSPAADRSGHPPWPLRARPVRQRA